MHASDSNCKLLWSKSSHCWITTLLSPKLIVLEWPRFYKSRLSILVPVNLLTLLKYTISPEMVLDFWYVCEIIESRAANIAPESNPSLTISFSSFIRGPSERTLKDGSANISVSESMIFWILFFISSLNMSLWGMALTQVLHWHIKLYVASCFCRSFTDWCWLI